MVGLQETGAGGGEQGAPAGDPPDEIDESTEHQFDSEFAIGTVIDERPRAPFAPDPFADLDERLRELHEQIARLRRRIGVMSGGTLER